MGMPGHGSRCECMACAAINRIADIDARRALIVPADELARLHDLAARQVRLEAEGCKSCAAIREDQRRAADAAAKVLHGREEALLKARAENSRLTRELNEARDQIQRGVAVGAVTRLEETVRQLVRERDDAKAARDRAQDELAAASRSLDLIPGVEPALRAELRLAEQARDLNAAALSAADRARDAVVAELERERDPENVSGLAGQLRDAVDARDRAMSELARAAHPASCPRWQRVAIALSLLAWSSVAAILWRLHAGQVADLAPADGPIYGRGVAWETVPADKVPTLSDVPALKDRLAEMERLARAGELGLMRLGEGPWLCPVHGDCLTCQRARESTAAEGGGWRMIDGRWSWVEGGR